jgi:hypothetical protein
LKSGARITRVFGSDQVKLARLVTRATLVPTTLRHAYGFSYVGKSVVHFPSFPGVWTYGSGDLAERVSLATVGDWMGREIRPRIIA